MYQLERISIHNWYLLEGRDIEVAGSVALIGQTGAGKSAIVDAIQTVMSGNNRNVIRLNSAAGETRDRRMMDYCLGCVTDVDDGKPQRSSSEAVLALTFARPGGGCRVAFGLLLSAHADEPGERTAHRFVIKGQGFRLQDFWDVEPDGNCYMPRHDALLARMKAHFSARKDAFTLHSTAQAFVREYLTAMRPKASPDPARFQSTFANALAAREVRDPGDFVRRFVLEAKPLNIKRVRESIATWRSLQDEADRLEKMLAEAKEVRSRFVTWARHKFAKAGADFAAAHAGRLRLGIELEADEARRAAIVEEVRVAEAGIHALSGENERLEDENKRDRLVEAQSEAVVKRQLLNESKRAAQQARIAAVGHLQRQLKPYLGAVQLGRLHAHLPASASDGVQAAVVLAGIAGPPLESWAHRWAEVGALATRISALVRAKPSLEQQAAAAMSDAAGLKDEITDLDARIAAAKQAGALMSTQTIRFRQELAARGIAAAALPDVVEVPDQRWAFALEALLGAHREALIVPSERLDEAFTILFRNRNLFDGCRLVNTGKTRGSHARLPPGSIAEVASTSDPDARAFIDAHVGRYVRAENEHDLSRLDQGVMPNGKTSQGLTLRVFRDKPPILGKTAQAAAQDAARTRRDGATTLLDGCDKRAALLQAGLRALAALDAAAPSDLEADARALADAMDRLASAERELAGLAEADGDGPSSRVREREGWMAANKQKTEDLRRASSKASKTLGGIERDLTDKASRSSLLLSQEDELLAAQATDLERRLLELSGSDPITAVRDRMENKRLLAWQGREMVELKREEAEARARSAACSQDATKSLNSAESALLKYLRTGDQAGMLPEDAEAGGKLLWISSRVAQIEGHQLLPHRHKVAEARGEMERMLKEDLLAKLDERLQDAGRQIDILNRRLKGHTFVGQTYSFQKRAKENMRPLVELARHVADNPRLDYDALQRSSLSPALRSALDRIEDIVGTDADISEIEDYRTYYEYDLLLKQGDETPVSFAKVMGKLSGGQRQAPYYVAIAASMMSVYYPGGRAGDTDGMGLVLFDEAFNKLDVRNTRALLELFRGLGLQVVVAAPEMNRATFLESVDTIVTVARQPGSAGIYLETMQPGPRAREAMRAANPEHAGVAGFRAAAAE